MRIPAYIRNISTRIRTMFHNTDTFVPPMLRRDYIEMSMWWYSTPEGLEFVEIAKLDTGHLKQILIDINMGKDCLSQQRKIDNLLAEYKKRLEE